MTTSAIGFARSASALPSRALSSLLEHAHRRPAGGAKPSTRLSIRLRGPAVWTTSGACARAGRIAPGRRGASSSGRRAIISDLLDDGGENAMGGAGGEDGDSRGLAAETHRARRQAAAMGNTSRVPSARQAVTSTSSPRKRWSAIMAAIGPFGSGRKRGGQQRLRQAVRGSHRQSKGRLPHAGSGRCAPLLAAACRDPAAALTSGLAGGRRAFRAARPAESAPLPAPPRDPPSAKASRLIVGDIEGG